MELKRVEEKAFEERIGFPTQYGPIRSDRKPGTHLIPHEIFRDTVVILIMVAIMWFLSALGPPTLSRPANPTSQPFTMPDWYLLWTFGLVKVSTIFPTIRMPGIPEPLGPGFFAAQLTAVPIIALLLLPFLDRGFEARPVKAAVRSAVGVLGLIWVFGASLVAVDTNVDKWYASLSGGQSLGVLWIRLWFIVPPLLGAIATYVALRRLAFKPMRRTNVATSGAALIIFLLYVLIAYVAWPTTHGGPGSLWAISAVAKTYLVILLGLLASIMISIFMAVTFMEETRAKVFLLPTLTLLIFIAIAMPLYLLSFDQAGAGPALQNLAVHSQFIIGLPLLSLTVGYYGLRTPYSDYEYKLNECYQCGRCHLVCPITKADADALGGLNLVYNVYKRQHDGVPMWACLTCDACSAVCPLDINYSVYVLTERARTMKVARYAPTMRATAADGGKEGKRGD